MKSDKSSSFDIVENLWGRPSHIFSDSHHWAAAPVSFLPPIKDPPHGILETRRDERRIFLPRHFSYCTILPVILQISFEEEMELPHIYHSVLHRSLSKPADMLTLFFTTVTISSRQFILISNLLSYPRKLISSFLLTYLQSPLSFHYSYHLHIPVAFSDLPMPSIKFIFWPMHCFMPWPL